MKQLTERLITLDLPVGQSCFFWGARKTGKSTYLKKHYPDALYINLLESEVYQFYLAQPHLIRDTVKAHPNTQCIILDEVQKVPLLLDEVHHLIETYETKNFILCGSSARRLKATGSNLLGGRAWRFLLSPFCYPEIKHGGWSWNKIFNQGLIPAHYLSDVPVQKSLSAYLYDYILPEVQFEANLRKRDSFARFMDVLAFCHGEMLNYSNIARDCGVDAKTIRTYFEILEDMYLGYYVHPFQSRTHRQTVNQHPKFYLFDTGLANYLRRYDFKGMYGAEAGKSFEHYVFLELMAHKNLRDKRDNIFYWRTKDGHEVDFIFEDKAIEVKISVPISKSHLKGLLKFSADHPTYSLHVISMEPSKRMIHMDNKEITIWPIQEFLEVFWA
ncbi:MAG: ATP-binding protein [Gammaproteobacteria bacterium]